jgi:hemerythrin-like domain-containing protein
MSDPIGAWHSEHACFGRLLALMRAQVDVLHTGERPNYGLMLDIVSYLRDFTDRHHHPREDVAFTRLARRCPDMTYELASLVQEHRVIARAGESLLKHLAAILDGSIASRADVEAAAATYLVYYTAHLAREERDVLTLAAEVMTPADWSAVDSAVPPARDPLFGSEPDERYRELRRQIALEA